MVKLHEVCRQVRSKNAGPFWVTVDLFFDGPENYARYRDAFGLSADVVAKAFGADPALVKRFAVDYLSVVKISYPRKAPQGGAVERDMHSGQQYVRLLDTELS
ncbi:DUF4387 domain-containing protein [Caulobacter sp. X]|uniref:DUF4387 domain-containing protein n=1 Tax=Caulobacter sp. X TaxID=2048901 RepID=UPI000C15948D|nr:DUF4387 domain-containing protein [Caulobacter sp. X]PIC00553.1 hypothetical protein CSW60_03035 [Caulobacter sp. X]